MTTHSQQRHADPIAGDESAADVDWISFTRLSYGIAQVCTRRVGDTLMVGAAGAGEPRPGDWGEVAADGVFALPTPTGFAFMATFDGSATGAATSCRLYTNQAHGVLAVHGFHRFTDGSGRRDYFTREFYAPTAGDRADGEPPAFPTAWSDDSLPAALLTGANDPGAVAGSWINMDRNTMRISALECRSAGGDLLVRAYGPDGDDWGETRADLYADSSHPDGMPAVLATFELGDRRVYIQLRDYYGLGICLEYARFTDGSGRTDFYHREAFRR
jgi:hypothetical protein